MSLPEVELGTSWGDRPTYQVRGKGFLLHRAPHRTAIDPATGEMYDDLLVISTGRPTRRRWSRTRTCRSSPSTTSAATRPCWSSSPASGRSARDELAEVITDAWLARAPRSLAKSFLDG